MHFAFKRKCESIAPVHTGELICLLNQNSSYKHEKILYYAIQNN